MKIKQTPEDFIVEEILEPKLSQEGKYSLYKLEKTSLDTLEAKRIIIKKYKIPYPDIGVAGLKDKHAKTSQYITINSRNGKGYNFQEKNIKLSFLGYVDQPLRSGDLEKNRFTITVRALKKGELDKVKKNINEVKQFGVPNYFDSQRFGSLKGTNDFVAKYLIFDDFENGLKAFMTRSTGFEKGIVRQCRREIELNWGKWDYLVQKCKFAAMPMREEYRILEFLAKNPTDFIGAFKMLDKAIKELFISAYQSYLWNECVKLYLKQKMPKTHDVPYAAGMLAFYRQIHHDLIGPLKTAEMPLLSKKVQLTEEQQKIVEKVLNKEGIHLEDLVIKKMTALFFKERPRKIIMMPEHLEESNFANDELNQRTFKMRLSFNLEKGAYATVILKRIFQM